jgi:hypothetical protein
MVVALWSSGITFKGKLIFFAILSEIFKLMKLRNKILTIIVLGLISVSLSSQSTTFNGGGDGTSWNDAGN